MTKTKRMLVRFALEAVVAPLVSTVMAKVGEAAGDLLAYRINPPEPEPPREDFNDNDDVIPGPEDESATD